MKPDLEKLKAEILATKVEPGNRCTWSFARPRSKATVKSLRRWTKDHGVNFIIHGGKIILEVSRPTSAVFTGWAVWSHPEELSEK